MMFLFDVGEFHLVYRLTIHLAQGAEKNFFVLLGASAREKNITKQVVVHSILQSYK